jgi:hypothetical protein
MVCEVGEVMFPGKNVVAIYGKIVCEPDALGDPPDHVKVRVRVIEPGFQIT